MHRERRHIVRLLLLRFNADDVERRTATFTQLLFPLCLSLILLSAIIKMY